MFGIVALQVEGTRYFCQDSCWEMYCLRELCFVELDTRNGEEEARGLSLFSCTPYGS